MAFEIADRGSGLSPGGHAAPGASGRTDRQDEGAFRQVLRADRSHGTPRIADKPNAYIWLDGKPEIDGGLDLAINEQVVPARREEGKEPGGSSEALRRPAQIAKALLGVGGDGGVGTAA